MACRSYQHLECPDDSVYNACHVACARFSASSPFVRRQADLEGIVSFDRLDITNTFPAMSYATCAYTSGDASMFPTQACSRLYLTAAQIPLTSAPPQPTSAPPAVRTGAAQTHSPYHGSRASMPMLNEFLVTYVMNINVAAWVGSQLCQGHHIDAINPVNDSMAS